MKPEKRSAVTLLWAPAHWLDVSRADSCTGRFRIVVAAWSYRLVPTLSINSCNGSFLANGHLSNRNGSVPSVVDFEAGVVSITCSQQRKCASNMVENWIISVLCRMLHRRISGGLGAFFFALVFSSSARVRTSAKDASGNFLDGPKCFFRGKNEIKNLVKQRFTYKTPKTMKPFSRVCLILIPSFQAERTEECMHQLSFIFKRSQFLDNAPKPDDYNNI